VSINIACSEYDKISPHFYRVNFRSSFRIILTSIYGAKLPYLMWYKIRLLAALSY